MRLRNVLECVKRGDQVQDADAREEINSTCLGELLYVVIDWIYVTGGLLL
jgi:hypothetical protein